LECFPKVLGSGGINNEEREERSADNKQLLIGYGRNVKPLCDFKFGLMMVLPACAVSIY
jgi:hypothetical protein